MPVYRDRIQTLCNTAYRKLKVPSRGQRPWHPGTNLGESWRFYPDRHKVAKGSSGEQSHAEISGGESGSRRLLAVAIDHRPRQFY